MKPLGKVGVDLGQQPPRDQNYFFNEINRIGRDLENAEQFLYRLDRLRGEVFSSVNQNQTADNISALSDEAKSTFRNIIKDLARLKQTPGAAGAPARQIDAKQRKLKELQETFKEKERALENAVRDQMRDQLRKVRPELDEEAIAEAVPDSTPQQIFANATMQSARKGQATATLGAVKARSEALAKIVRDFEQISEMFSELESMVLQQEEMVTHIEAKGEETKDEVTQAEVELGTAVESAKAARRKKWWCLGIFGESRWCRCRFRVLILGLQCSSWPLASSLSASTGSSSGTADPVVRARATTTTTVTTTTTTTTTRAPMAILIRIPS